MNNDAVKFWLESTIIPPKRYDCLTPDGQFYTDEELKFRELYYLTDFYTSEKIMVWRKVKIWFIRKLRKILHTTRKNKN